MIGFQRDGIGLSRNLEGDRRQGARRRRFIRRYLRLQLDPVAPHDAKERVPPVYDAPGAANTSATRPAIGARNVKAFPDAVPPPLRSISSRCARRALAAVTRASATAAARRASSTRRPGTARSSSSRSARARSAFAPSSAACASATVDSREALSSPPLARRGSSRPSVVPAATDRRRWQLLRRVASIRWGGDDGVTAGDRFNGGRHTNRSGTSPSRTTAVANGFVHCCSLR